MNNVPDLKCLRDRGPPKETFSFMSTEYAIDPFLRGLRLLSLFLRVPSFSYSLVARLTRVSSTVNL